MQIQCPYCGQVMEATASQVHCPRCNKVVDVNQSSRKTTAPRQATSRPSSPPAPVPAPRPAQTNVRSTAIPTPAASHSGTHPYQRPAPKQKKSFLVPVLVAIILGLLLFGGVGIGITVYLLSSEDLEVAATDPDPDSNNPVTNSTSPASSSPDTRSGDSSSKTGGSFLSNLLPKAKLDAETESDKKIAQQFFNQQQSVEGKKNVKWTGKPLYVPIYGDALDKAVSVGPRCTSRSEAMEGLKEANAEHKKMYLEIAGLVPEPLEIKEMRRIGSVFFVEFDGIVGGNELEMENRIEVAYSGISISKRPDSNGRINVEVTLSGGKQARSIYSGTKRDDR